MVTENSSAPAVKSRGQLVLYKLEVTRPISGDLFLHVSCAQLLCLSKPLLASGSLEQFDNLFPQDPIRSPPKHPLLDHKLQKQATLDRNPQ